MTLYLVRWKLDALRKSGRMLVKADDEEAAANEALARLKDSPVYMQYWHRAPFEIDWVRDLSGSTLALHLERIEAGDG